MRCQNCGAEVPDRHIFCEKCGVVIVRPIQFDEKLIVGAKQAVTRAIERRRSTDRVIPLTIIWLYIIMIGVLLFFSILYAFSDDTSSGGDFAGGSSPTYEITFGGSTIGTLILLYLFYRLIERQNDHYLRDRELRVALISLVRAAASSPESKKLVENDLLAMELVNRTAEIRRKPWFWVTIAALPIVISIVFNAFSMLSDFRIPDLSTFVVILIAILAVMFISFALELIMFRFLGKSMYEHDMRWAKFSQTTRNAMSKLGFPAGRPLLQNRLPERSFALYLVLTIVTGLFVFYWLYVLVKDPNDHFKNQWEFEDDLLGALGVRIVPEFKNGGWVP